MRRIVTVLTATTALLLVHTSILAQSPIPSDGEIAAAYAACNKPENFISMGSRGNRPDNAGQYKPEWKAAGCDRIDAEHEKRGLAKKAQDGEAQKKLRDLLNRLPN